MCALVLCHADGVACCSFKEIVCLCCCCSNLGCTCTHDVHLAGGWVHCCHFFIVGSVGHCAVTAIGELWCREVIAENHGEVVAAELHCRCLFLNRGVAVAVGHGDGLDLLGADAGICQFHALGIACPFAIGEFAHICGECQAASRHVYLADGVAFRHGDGHLRGLHLFNDIVVETQ